MKKVSLPIVSAVLIGFGSAVIADEPLETRPMVMTESKMDFVVAGSCGSKGGPDCK